MDKRRIKLPFKVVIKTHSTFLNLGLGWRKRRHRKQSDRTQCNDSSLSKHKTRRRLNLINGMVAHLTITSNLSATSINMIRATMDFDASKPMLAFICIWSKSSWSKLPAINRPVVGQHRIRGSSWLNLTIQLCEGRKLY